MSEIYLKKEIKSIVRNAGIKADYKMVCPIIKIMNMKYENIDARKVRNIANEIISEEILA